MVTMTPSKTAPSVCDSPGMVSPCLEVTEGGVTLRVTVLESAGFGGGMNNERCWEPVLQTLETRLEDFLAQERAIDRSAIADRRIHACIYMIPPNGHTLRPLDLQVMKMIHQRVNLIPIIAKADTLTDNDMASFRQRVKDRAV